MIPTKLPSVRKKERWMLEGYTEEESITLAKSRTPGVIEYYTIFKGLPLEEAKIKLSEWWDNKKLTKDNMIKKWGKEEGLKRWDSYREKQALSNKFEYKQKHHGWTQEQFDEYNKNRSQTLENMILRHGELEGSKKWKSYCKTQKTVGISLQYFQQKYGYLEGKEKFDDVCGKKGHGVEGFVARGHSEEESKKLNSEWLSKQLNTINTSLLARSSKISEEFIDELIFSCDLDICEVYSTKYNGEWFVRTSETIYFVDFYHKPTGTIIEFFGDYWHGNPLKYEESHLISYGNTKKTAKELWDKDAIRINTISKLPYVKNVLIIWESDYKTDPDNVIEQCKQLLIGNTTK